MCSPKFASVLSFALLSSVLASPLQLANGVSCDIVSESYIGEHNNVKAIIASCPDTSIHPRESLQSRQTNVCATACNTNCFLPSGGGPNPNDCTVIADAALYNGQNTSPTFTTGTGTGNTWVFKYSSCEAQFVNQDSSSIVYCCTDLANNINNLAWNCQSTQNAHGGNCVATDQSYYIQVQAAA